MNDRVPEVKIFGKIRFDGKEFVVHHFEVHPSMGTAVITLMTPEEFEAYKNEINRA